MPEALDLFSAPATGWFRGAFAAPTDVQEKGWRSVAGGSHTLMCAPTGSGKTLAAFLWCLDRLAAEPVPTERERCRVLYVSPLKALTVDIERNLRAPLTGIELEAQKLGQRLPEIRVQVRTGDTPAGERRLIQRTPPDILITTPESLYLMLTSAAREVLTPVRWVIVDEIHAMAATKRGAHLSLSLERLCALTKADPIRIGLSATQRPLEEVARFLGGRDREVAIVDAGQRKQLEISVEVPVEDMANLEVGQEADEDGTPRRSIWPAVYPRILELIRAHRSTIVFVNSRRLAERLAIQLNELAGEDLARAHHGSIAKDQRLEIETGLKEGRLPALIATSSLELGIDMGAVDLVIQVEAPESVASGMQRIGRAGHSVGEPSIGTVLPKHRGDLLKCAAVVEGMLAGDIETTRVPRNPVDVLAQQIVAACALDEWDADELFALARRAYPFTDLSRRVFDSVLDMLAGRYPSDDFAELRPRIVWDRATGKLRGRGGAQRLAVISGGTIPDRGLFPANLLEDGRRIGELDEEMVYEMRPGQTFILGASTWRAADITPTEVLVTPAPGEAGMVAFWRGDALGRPVELGRAIGRLTRELRAAPKAKAEQRLREGAGLDDRAIKNLLRYLREQAEVTGDVPDDRTIVVERFKDQLGDWRVCVLTPFGARVHAPWALAAKTRLQEEHDVDVQSIHSDDGFCLRFPESSEAPDVDSIFFEPDEIRDLVSAELHGSPLFAARFRENAARSLLLPRRRPNERTPLWRQRQRSHDLLQVASAFPDFPVVLETYRECLHDLFDLDALAELLRGVRSREIRVTRVVSERASPFASSLLFDFIAVFMYEGDAPLGERRAQALTLDRGLLAELLGSEDLRELLDPGAVEALELELQGLNRERWPRDVDQAADVLRVLGDLRADEAEARGVLPEWLKELERDRRALSVRLAGEDRWIAVEDASRYRDALGLSLPVGLPQALLGPVADALESLLLRWARTNVPFRAIDVARRWALPEARIEQALQRLATLGRLLAGEFRPGAAGREYSHPDVLRSLRRKSLAALRKEIEPVPVEALARFLPQWQGIGAPGASPERLTEVIAQLQGAAVPASTLERDILPARLSGYRPQLLDQLLAGGDVVWVGQGTLGPGDGKVALLLRADTRKLLPAAGSEAPGELHGAIRGHLANRGASFFNDLLLATGGAAPNDLLEALWDMVWAGEVTNDSFLPVRMLSGKLRRATPGRRPMMRLAPPGAEGRWSLVAQLREPMAAPTERLHAQTAQLLARYGVLTREAVLAEGVAGGFSGLYPILRAMEEAGKTRRGYFIDGLGGSQFASAGAVDRLRALRDVSDGVVTLSAVDPANPYGAQIAWPESAAHLSRSAGAYVVLRCGELRLYLERGGRSLITLGEPSLEDVSALIATALRAGKLELHQVDGVSAQGSPLEALLRQAGFGSSPRGLVIWPERQARTA